MQGEKLAQFVGSLTEKPLAIKVPDNLKYRIYVDKDDNYIVHFMPTNVEAHYHPTVRLHKIGNPIVESLTYEVLKGDIEIAGPMKSAKLYSPDLEETKDIAVANNKAIVNINNLKRFFSIKLDK